MIKNIVFDLGNVVTSFHPYDHYIHLLKDEALTKACCHMVFEGEEWNAYDQGLYTKGEIQNILCAKYPTYKNEIQLILKDWVVFLKTIPETVSLMKSLKKEGYQLYIISNLSEESYLHILSEPYFKLVEGAVLSFQEKINKPDKRIYEIFLNRYHLQAHECVFLDDRSANIEAAKTVGMHGIVYQSHTQAVRELRYRIIEEKEC